MKIHLFHLLTLVVIFKIILIKLSCETTPIEVIHYSENYEYKKNVTFQNRTLLNV